MVLHIISGSTFAKIRITGLRLETIGKRSVIFRDHRIILTLITTHVQASYKSGSLLIDIFFNIKNHWVFKFVTHL